MIAFISDIHGNLIALNQFEEYIKSIGGVSDIYFLGDAINYYPNSSEILSWLEAQRAKCIYGNHEVLLMSNKVLSKEKDAIYRLEETRKSLSDQNLDFLNTWQKCISLRLNSKKVLLVHGSPIDNQEGYIYPDTDLSVFKSNEHDVVICGHSHYSFIRKNEEKIFINVGSVGLPRDQGDYISFGILDEKKMKFTLKRLKMNLSKIKSNFELRVHPSVLKLLDRKDDNFANEIQMTL